MSANDQQHGGDHYQTPYQYWDFVHDAGLGYHDGCAGKYLVRWEKKGTPELDLNKACHFLEKCIELGISARLYSGLTTEQALDRFLEANSLGAAEARALGHIVRGNYILALAEAQAIRTAWNAAHMLID